MRNALLLLAALAMIVIACTRAYHGPVLAAAPVAPVAPDASAVDAPDAVTPAADVSADVSPCC